MAKLSKRQRKRLQQKEEQKQRRNNKQADFLKEKSADIVDKIDEDVEVNDEVQEEENEFFEFVRRRTNGFQYLLSEYYGFIENSCGKRGEFDQPLNGRKEIDFYFRFREFQSMLNSEKSFYTEKVVLENYLKKISDSANKDAKTITYEMIVNCRLQVIESLGN